MKSKAIVEVLQSREIVEAHLGDIRAQLLVAESPEDLKQIIDKTTHLARIAKAALLSFQSVNQIQEIRLEAEIKLGHVLIGLKNNGELAQGGDKKTKSLRTTLMLSDYGISRDLSARSQTLAKAEAKAFARKEEILKNSQELSILALFDELYWITKVDEFTIPEPWQSLFLPLLEVKERFLNTREFSPATVRRLCADAARIEAMLVECGGDVVGWHNWLKTNKGGASWDVRLMIQRGRELENKRIESEKVLNWFIGDWREHVGALENGSVAAFITDPPYGLDYQSDYRLDRRKERKHKPIQNDRNPRDAADELGAALAAFAPKLKADSAIFVFCQWQNECLTRSVIDQVGFKIRNSLIWVKHTTGMGDPKTTFAPKHERIIFAVKGSPMLFERLADVLEAERPNSKRHPTEKPIELLQQLISVTTVIGDLIVDPFGGVASTLDAASKLDRGAWGCELNEKYHSAGLERLGL